jgi:predicted  nucleic acid-binding Zn-ribbon protein
MPHQCIHCGNIIPADSKEILTGCNKCGGRFFFYIRDETLNKLKEKKQEEAAKIVELKVEEKTKIESDVRKILNVENEKEPVILDFESVQVVGPGKFEIDLINLLNNKPIIFKLEEGKYLIDLESAMPKEQKKK